LFAQLENARWLKHHQQVRADLEQQAAEKKELVAEIQSLSVQAAGYHNDETQFRSRYINRR